LRLRVDRTAPAFDHSPAGGVVGAAVVSSPRSALAQREL
jgi:hypothetical protein